MERKTATRRYYTRGSSCDIVALQQKETPVLTVEVARMQGRRLLVDARRRGAFTRSREEGGGLHSARRRDSAQGFIGLRSIRGDSAGEMHVPPRL